MRNYKNLEVWKLSKEIVLDLYKVTTNFPQEELYGLTSQIRRASVSISANIAEGNGKDGDIELRRFLRIAVGSASELETLLIIAYELDYLEKENFEVINKKLESTKKMLNYFINKLNSHQLPAISH